MSEVEKSLRIIFAKEIIHVTANVGGKIKRKIGNIDPIYRANKNITE
jgi:hypothetical protein